MTDIDNQEHSPNNQPDRWAKLDKYLEKKVAEASRAVSRGMRGAAEDVEQLNKIFESEGLIGLPAYTDADIPLVVGSTVTDNGVIEEAVVSVDMIKAKKYSGTFCGCVIERSGSGDSDAHLMYVLEADKGSYDQLLVKFLTDDGRLYVEEQQKTDELDEIVTEAFEILEAVKDEQYSNDVSSLQLEYWNTGGDLLTRLKSIGIFASSLLAHPLSNDELEEAIGTIVAFCLEDNMTYKLAGIRVSDEVDEDGEEALGVVSVYSPQYMQRATVRLVDNFDFSESEQGGPDIICTNTYQPAFVFFNLQKRVEEVFPLRFLSQIEEYEYNSDDFVDNSYEVAARHYAPAGGFMTHGEIYREYMQREARLAALGKASVRDEITE